MPPRNLPVACVGRPPPCSACSRRGSLGRPAAATRSAPAMKARHSRRDIFRVALFCDAMLNLSQAAVGQCRTWTNNCGVPSTRGAEGRPHVHTNDRRACAPRKQGAHLVGRSRPATCCDVASAVLQLATYRCGGRGMHSCLTSGTASSPRSTDREERPPPAAAGLASPAVRGSAALRAGARTGARAPGQEARRVAPRAGARLLSSGHRTCVRPRCAEPAARSRRAQRPATACCAAQPSPRRRTRS